MTSLVEAASSGDYRATLEALRDRLAAELEDASSREVAPLAKQLQDVLATLDKLPSEREVTLEDELDKRRQARESGSDVQDGSNAKSRRG